VGVQYQFEVRKFPNLPRAPIVEGVLHWQATASVDLDESSLRLQLEDKFPGYSLKSHHDIEAAFTDSPEGVEVKHSKTWKGFRLTKAENDKQVFVCQFKQDGITFSRLSPYTGWDEFMPYALEFWRAFVEICQPKEVARLGARYISEIPINSVEQVGDFIEDVSSPLKVIGIPPRSFFHQDTFDLPGTRYCVNLIRAVQSSQEDGGNSLIVDIDVFTAKGIDDFQSIETILSELRYIKNDVFFTVMKDADEKFKGV
jgi:uncharacterized protein (TIGR04255 family)